MPQLEREGSSPLPNQSDGAQGGKHRQKGLTFTLAKTFILATVLRTSTLEKAKMLLSTGHLSGHHGNHPMPSHTLMPTKRDSIKGGKSQQKNLSL